MEKDESATYKANTFLTAENLRGLTGSSHATGVLRALPELSPVTDPAEKLEARKLRKERGYTRRRNL